LPHPDYGTFVGREEELAKAHRILRPYPHSQHALVAISGIGGIGKSALALEVVHYYLRNYDRLPSEQRFEAIIWTSAKPSVLTADGIFPRQQATRTLEDMFTDIAITLEREDITRARPEDQSKLVARALVQQRTLLVVDNLETVDDERVYQFLRELPAPTKAIVTTRYSIDVSYPVRLAGLPWEASQKLILQECAKKDVELRPEQSSRIYDCTQGVPLAIVWTVAQIGLGHSVETVLTRLGQPTGDIARYCFGKALDYVKERDSYKTLTALAVMPSSATPEMLGLVAGFGKSVRSQDDALVELERLSLVTRQGGRCELLPLVKQYVLETCSLERRDEYLLRAAKSYARFLRKHVGDERMGSARGLGYDALEAERLNVFGLIDWCYENEQWELVTQLVLAMGYFPHARGYWQDAIKYWELGASASQFVGDKVILARCITYLGYMHLFWGDYEEAQRYVRLACLATDQSVRTYQLASIRRLQGCLASVRGDDKEAMMLFSESLSMMREVRNTHGISRLLNSLGELACSMGDYTAAERYLNEGLTISKAGDDETEMTRGWRHLGDLARLCSRHEEARGHYKRSLSSAQEIGWKDEIGQAKHALAHLEWECGNVELAEALALEALAVYEQLGQSARADGIRSMLSAWGLGKHS
jgi:LuxR family glucitol operon transcriptional activator